MDDGALDSVELTRVADLGAADRQAWSNLVDGRRALSSPFFHPEYHRLVDDSRGPADPRIEAVIGRDRTGGVVLVWPFEREGRRLAVPAGRFLTDYQGVIADGVTSVDPERLLRTARLDRWRFDHLPVDQGAFDRWRRKDAASPVLDLTSGFDAYAADARSAVRDADTKRRRLERRIGPVRFEYRTEDSAVLEALITWKSAQYRATGKRDVFAVEWCRRLAAVVPTVDEPGFVGCLSALWAGDHLVAAHLGLRSSSVWHWWLPGYDPEFGRFSPGLNLLVEMARRSADLGVSVIDLGKGDEAYKRRVANNETVVSSGVVELRNARWAGRAAGRWARGHVRRAAGGGT